MNDPRLLSDEEFEVLLAEVESRSDERSFRADRQARIEESRQLRAELVEAQIKGAGIGLAGENELRAELVEAQIKGAGIGLAGENERLLAEVAVLREALSWYAANHRPEDYLNDNGDRAGQALASIDEPESKESHS